MNKKTIIAMALAAAAAVPASAGPKTVFPTLDGKAPLVEAAIKERVKALTDRFPIYQ